jgi:asparagine N-glycosylation enzyme membrane subunit Stt3
VTRADKNSAADTDVTSDRMTFASFMLQIVHVLANRAQPKSVVKMAAVAGVAIFFARGFFGGWTVPLLATGLFFLALFTLVMTCLVWLEERLNRKP